MRIWALSPLLMIAGGLALGQPVVNPVLNPVAPGSLVSLFGTSLSSTIQTASTVPLSMSVADVSSVTIGGASAAVLFVSPGQINLQVPWEAVPGPASLVITNGAGSSQTVQIQVAAYAPVIMNFGFGASAQAFATNMDGTLNGPVNTPASVAGVVTHPEFSGNPVTIYATGLGPVSSPPADGAASADQARPCTGTAFVTVGGANAQVVSCGLSSQYVGVYQLAFVVPYGITPGNDLPVQIQMTDPNSGNTVASANSATIATQ